MHLSKLFSEFYKMLVLEQSLYESTVFKSCIQTSKAVS